MLQRNDLLDIPHSMRHIRCGGVVSLEKQMRERELFRNGRTTPDHVRRLAEIKAAGRADFDSVKDQAEIVQSTVNYATSTTVQVRHKYGDALLKL